MAMSRKSSKNRAESLLRLGDGRQQEFSLVIVSVVHEPPVMGQSWLYLTVRCIRAAVVSLFVSVLLTSTRPGAFRVSTCIDRSRSRWRLPAFAEVLNSSARLLLITSSIAHLYFPFMSGKRVASCSNRCLVFWGFFRLKLSSEHGRRKAVCLLVSSVLLRFCPVCSCLVCFPLIAGPSGSLVKVHQLSLILLMSWRLDKGQGRYSAVVVRSLHGLHGPTLKPHGKFMFHTWIINKQASRKP